MQARYVVEHADKTAWTGRGWTASPSGYLHMTGPEVDRTAARLRAQGYPVTIVDIQVRAAKGRAFRNAFEAALKAGADRAAALLAAREVA